MNFQIDLMLLYLILTSYPFLPSLLTVRNISNTVVYCGDRDIKNTQLYPKKGIHI